MKYPRLEYNTQISASRAKSRYNKPEKKIKTFFSQACHKISEHTTKGTDTRRMLTQGNDRRVPNYMPSSKLNWSITTHKFSDFILVTGPEW